ncbi:MAG: hypothetical protein JWQ81_6901 [Amycolatopsis sp.]|nr:hypothetical protein [Amycolatopsis sp.]
MVATATQRYDVEAAPGGVALVQELLNTTSAGKPRKPDLLADLDSARGWLDRTLDDWSAATGRPAPPIELDDVGREQLLDVREQLHALAGHPVGGERAPSFDSAGARLVIGSDGLVRVEPGGTGWRRVVSLILIEVLDAQQTDQWRRLKTCHNPRCGVTFYDRSRNNSGVWHDFRVCGNAANVRAHRARGRTS